MTALVRSVLRYVVTHNSLYLLSGLCLLFGYYQVMGAQATSGPTLGIDLALVGTFKLYEILVVLAACIVFKRLYLENDGLLLGCMALVLFCDPTLFSSRFFAASRPAGFIVSSACLGLVVFNLFVLKECGRLPISVRAFRGLVGSAAVIYFGPGLLDADFTSASFANPLSQDHRYYLLWWAPLVMALLARRWREDGDRPGERSAFAIYYRYLDTVIMFFPFVLVIRQLWMMQGVFEVQYYSSCGAPALLGIAVLVEKISPRFFDRQTGVAAAIGIATILLSTSYTPEAMATLPGGFEINPLRVMVLLNGIVSCGLWVRSSDSRYLGYAVLCSTFFVSGSTLSSAMDGIVGLKPAPVAVFWALSMIAAIVTRRLLEVAWAGELTVFLATRIAGLDPAETMFAFIQANGYGVLVLRAIYGTELLEGLCTPAAGVLLVTSFTASHVRVSSSLLVDLYFYGQIVGLYLLGRRWSMQGLSALSSGMAGVEICLSSFTRLSAIDLAALGRQFGGVGLILSAFACLFGGLAVSFKKDRLLALLADEPAPSAQSVPPAAPASRE